MMTGPSGSIFDPVVDTAKPRLRARDADVGQQPVVERAKGRQLAAARVRRQGKVAAYLA